MLTRKGKRFVIGNLTVCMLVYSVVPENRTESRRQMNRTMPVAYILGTYEIKLYISTQCKKYGPEGITLFSCSTQLSTNVIMLINVKMLIIVCILTFICMIHT